MHATTRDLQLCRNATSPGEAPHTCIARLTTSQNRKQIASKEATSEMQTSPVASPETLHHGV